jgi:signal transduction histidine kinase
LLGLVENLLNLQPGEAGEPALSLQPLALAPSVQAALAPLALARRVSVHRGAIAPALRVRADPSRLHKLLQAMDGTLALHSSPGHGTVVNVELPAA